MPASQLPLHLDPRANAPFFDQLRQQSAWLIASGELQPGDRLPPIRALAKHLGIHMHTVRQAYHALAADGLVESRPGRGTRVTPFDLSTLEKPGSALPSHTIGVLIPNMFSFYDPFLDGVELIARRSGYMIMVCFTRDNEALTRRVARQLVAKNVDGLIAASPVAGVFDQDSPLPSPRTPIVYVDAPQYGAHTILLDLDNAGFLAAGHLIRHGHRRIGMITAPLKWPNFCESYHGYCRALSASNLDLDPSLIIETPDYSLESGIQAALRYLELRDPPKALFVSGDLMAAGVIQALRECGKRIPDDFSIVSKDNIELSALIDPPLTTVTLPAYQMGVEAMTMVTRLVAGKKPVKKRVVLGSELIIRKSCGCR